MNKEVADEVVSGREAAVPVAASTPVAPAALRHETPQAGAGKEVERGDIFTRLVTGDADIVGLVAYSIYKQNKLDWLAAFETARARAPDEAELASYIIGEGTARRLATYRQLAEATLAGQPTSDGRGRLAGSGAGRLAPTPGLIALYALVALLFVLGFWLAARFTMGR